MDEAGFFKTLKNAAKMKDVFLRAGEMSTQLEQMKHELGRKTVEADAGAGAVRVVMNGHLQVVQVKLDRPLLQSLAASGNELDQQMVEDLIAAATNSAIAKARELIGQELQQITGGLNIPGLNNLFGGADPPQ